jgi:hypothetical protein
LRYSGIISNKKLDDNSGIFKNIDDINLIETIIEDVVK